MKLLLGWDTTWALLEESGLGVEVDTLSGVCVCAVALPHCARYMSITHSSMIPSWVPRRHQVTEARLDQVRARGHGSRCRECAGGWCLCLCWCTLTESMGRGLREQLA